MLRHKRALCEGFFINTYNNLNKMTKTNTQSEVLLTQTTCKQQYQKPTFEVIDLKMESPLLAGSQGAGFTPIQRKKE